MKQKIRRTIILISLLLFPITLNFFSPYVSIDGAMNGIISGSLLIFAFMLISALFFGRAWCSWICPVAALSDLCIGINSKKVNIKKLRIVRYSIFTVWAVLLIAMFIMAGGIKGIDPLHLTESGISVDMPIKYIVYYMVLFLFVIVTILVGKRGACHSFCWMSPFLVAGTKVGRMLKMPQLKIKADSSACIECGRCNEKCPMSINVSDNVKAGYIYSQDCILCGDCIECCKKNVLSYNIARK